MLNYNEYLELIKTRRSIRKFKDEKVSEEDIKKIIDAARYAPSGMNSQPWEYIVIRDKALIQEFVSMSEDDMKISPLEKKIFEKQMKGKKPLKLKMAQNAPVLIIAVGDTRKKISLPGQMYQLKDGKLKIGKRIPIHDNDEIFVSSMATSFLQMLTAATSLGLASQYCTIVTSPRKKVKEKLNIPSYMKIYDAAAIGYASYEPRQKYIRELDNIVHFDQYDTSKSWSDEYIAERAENKLDMKFVSVQLNEINEKSV